MTVAENTLNQIIEKKRLFNELRNEIDELESDLVGIEIKYKDYQYTVVEWVEVGEVTLYIEEDEDNSWNEMISVYDLKELIK